MLMCQGEDRHEPPPHNLRRLKEQPIRLCVAAIPRTKPFAQSLAGVIPFSSWTSKGRNTSPECKVSAMLFQWRMIKNKKSSKTACALKVSSRTMSSPQITGRYSLGSTSSGPQINAARKPSSCSRFIERLSPKRLRTQLSRSNSASANGCGTLPEVDHEVARPDPAEARPRVLEPRFVGTTIC